MLVEMACLLGIQNEIQAVWLAKSNTPGIYILYALNLMPSSSTVETDQYLVCKLGMKPQIYGLERSSSSLNNLINILNKIMNRVGTLLEN